VTNTAAMNPYAATVGYPALTANTVLRTAAAKVVKVSVITAGTAGAIFDAASTGGTANRQIAAIPATVGVYELNWPCASGVVVNPGTGQTIAISLA
jgi:hypothetical protein